MPRAADPARAANAGSFVFKRLCSFSWGWPPYGAYPFSSFIVLPWKRNGCVGKTVNARGSAPVAPWALRRAVLCFWAAWPVRSCAPILREALFDNSLPGCPLCVLTLQDMYTLWHRPRLTSYSPAGSGLRPARASPVCPPPVRAKRPRAAAGGVPSPCFGASEGGRTGVKDCRTPGHDPE